MNRNRYVSRRRFVTQAAGSGLFLGLGELPSLPHLPSVSADEVQRVQNVVRFASDIEPTVRFLEQTPRNQILEDLLVRTRDGLSYREIVAALLLAGVRNIPGSSPAHHRNVGGALHGIFVIYSAHRTSLNCPANERWLPILFAVDQFKRWQADGRGGPVQGNPRWQMKPVDESAVPNGAKAVADFVAALESWDEDAAEHAAAGLARSAGAGQAFDLLSRYAIRDYRYIGHKAIFVANAWRTLQFIGWRHAEPVLRSLGRALAAYYHQEGHPVRSDNRADRSWRHNQGLVGEIKPAWQAGTIDEAATVDLLATLRQGSDAEASEEAVALLNSGIAPRSIWDAIMCGVSEITMRWPDFNTLHAVTTINAMHYLYQNSGDENDRKLILLQAAAFVTFFRGESQGRTKYDERIDQLEPLDLDSSGDESIDEIIATIGTDRLQAARKTLTYLQRDQNANLLIRRTRQLLLRKGNNAHDYKFGAAAWEDFGSMSIPWRDRQLAATMFLGRSPTESDTRVFRRVEAATS
jgi:hypothetical protein